MQGSFEKKRMSSSSSDFLIAILPKIPASLSLLGSIAIINEVLLDGTILPRKGRNDEIRSTDHHHHQRRKKLWGESLQRVLLAMSCYDLFSSVVFFLSTWPMPKGTAPYAKGNMSTCNLTGFSYQFGLMGTYLSNCTLAFISLLVIKYNWSGTKLQSLEWKIHLSIFDKIFQNY